MFCGFLIEGVSFFGRKLRKFLLNGSTFMWLWRIQFGSQTKFHLLLSSFLAYQKSNVREFRRNFQFLKSLVPNTNKKITCPVMCNVHDPLSWSI